MPGKVFELNDGLSVTIYKRKGSRNLRLSITATGEVRVSIPSWSPYKAGVHFAEARQDWIRSQMRQTKLLVNGQAVGKAHHLLFTHNSGKDKVTSRVLDTTIIIRCPLGLDVADAAVQKVTREACVRALRSQAEQLLPQRLRSLADTYGFDYAGVSVKRLKGRWGSCDQNHNIVLNLYLMQLPWALIDYVLLHELSHTVALNHGSEFWEAFEDAMPNAKKLRKQIREHQPVLE